MAIEINVLHLSDENILLNVAPEVFDNPIDNELTKEFLADPRRHIAVVIDDCLVVGFASGVHYITAASAIAVPPRVHSKTTQRR
jgi:deoxyxylulose-5-phosphate synthase